MTLKYESEILFDLMKRDGDNAPSDVLPYESELKEKYLNQVVGAYPKLQDYRPEWLNYNLYHHLPSDFPTESVTNVTSASFHNVVPYAYGRAILKGNTLVNLVDYSHSNSSHFTKQINGHWSISVENNSKNLVLYNPLNQALKDNTLYTVIVDITKNNLSKEILLLNGYTTGKGVTVPLGYIGKLKLAFTTNSSAATGWNESLQSVVLPETTGEIELGDYILLEGDYTNIDIPYFEGMQSVKLPVLTTTGKNLFDGNLISGYFNNNISSIVGDGGKYKSILIKLNKGAYTLSFERPVYVIREIIDGVYNQNTRTATTYTFTLNTDGYYGISFREAVSETIWSQTQVMIEQGTVATSYEPYKTNILTVNEPIELRGIGEVQDTLDLLTGEVTERIGEYIYNGEIKPSYNNSIGGYVVTSGGGNANVGLSVGILSDKVKAQSFANNDTGVYGNMNGHFYIFDKTVSSADEFMDKYKGAVFQYHLASPTVKTVDLTCINEQGESETLRPIEGTMHVNTSSQTLLPLLDMSVPVEATSQNLMSFANIVEEEK